MAVSKVILNGTTLIDTTDKTVTAGSMLNGVTALKNDGTTATGSIASKSSADLTASGATVIAPAGYYASAASKTVSSGTAGTPTASKGTVSNHSISVTPSVTNTTGYISGGTKNGTAVTVSASELVSGTKSITENGTGIDVTNYAAVDVAVSGGSSVSVEPLSVTANGTYTAPSGTAYSPVTVNVSGGGGDLWGLVDGTITSIAIPSGMTSIRHYAFRGCGLLQTINIPDSVTSIGTNAFAECAYLTTVSANGSINGLLASTFYGCTALTDVHFPNMVGTLASNCFGASTAAYACANLSFADIGKASTISNSAFQRCSSLTVIVLRNSDAVCSLASTGAFTNTPFRGAGGTAYVPSALISSYQTATNWSTLYDGGTVTFVAIEGSEYEL